MYICIYTCIYKYIYIYIYIYIYYIYIIYTIIYIIYIYIIYVIYIIHTIYILYIPYIYRNVYILYISLYYIYHKTLKIDRWAYISQRGFLVGLIITLIIINHNTWSHIHRCHYWNHCKFVDNSLLLSPRRVKISTLSFYFLDTSHRVTFGGYVCMGWAYSQFKGKICKCM